MDVDWIDCQTQHIELAVVVADPGGESCLDQFAILMAVELDVDVDEMLDARAGDFFGC